MKCHAFIQNIIHHCLQTYYTGLQGERCSEIGCFFGFPAKFQCRNTCRTWFYDQKWPWNTPTSIEGIFLQQGVKEKCSQKWYNNNSQSSLNGSYANVRTTGVRVPHWLRPILVVYGVTPPGRNYAIGDYRDVRKGPHEVLPSLRLNNSDWEDTGDWTQHHWIVPTTGRCLAIGLAWPVNHIQPKP